MSKAVFLDRDGTLIEYLPYLHKPDDVRIIPGVDQALRILTQHHFRLIVITNQAGVAHGLFNEASIDAVHRRMVQMLNDRGCQIDAIYYCPHHPNAKSLTYRRRCSCRKPEIGLLIESARHFRLRLEDCYMVGDTAADALTGERSGGIGCMVLTGVGAWEFHHSTDIPNVFSTLLSAARWIIQRRGSSLEDSD